MDKDRTLAGHTHYVQSVCEVGGMLASGSLDKTVKLWDVRSGTCVKTLAGHTYAVYSVCEVGGMLASASWDNTVKLWPMTTIKNDVKKYGAQRVSLVENIILARL